MVTNQSSRSAIPWSGSDRHRDVRPMVMIRPSRSSIIWSSTPAPGCQAHGDDPVVEILDHLEQLRPAPGCHSQGDEPGVEILDQLEQLRPAPGCQAHGDEPGVEVGDPLEQLRPAPGCQAHGDDPAVEILDHLEQHAGTGMTCRRGRYQGTNQNPAPLARRSRGTLTRRERSSSQ
jgi:hypothetical protein